MQTLSCGCQGYSKTPDLWKSNGSEPLATNFGEKIEFLFSSHSKNYFQVHFTCKAHTYPQGQNGTTNTRYFFKCGCTCIINSTKKSFYDHSPPTYRLVDRAVCNFHGSMQANYHIALKDLKKKYDEEVKKLDTMVHQLITNDPYPFAEKYGSIQTVPFIKSLFDIKIE